MRLLRAWCEKDGKPALIAEVEPRENPMPTHGMCPAHRAQVEEELARATAEVRALREKAKDLEKDAAVLEKGTQTLRDQVDP